MLWIALVMLTAQAPAVGALTEHVACASDPSQTYTLYLPPGYSARDRRPLLLVFDPRGRGTVAANLFREGAERYGWIIASSDNTRSDGPWEPNQRALAALWPDVRQRYAVDEQRIYAAGFSGGATVAWALSRATGALAGIIETGAPEADIAAAQLPGTLAVFSAAGRLDFNYVHARRLDARVARAGHPHRLEFFEGPHAWMPQPAATRAIAWLELVAMQQGRRAQDEAFAKTIDALLQTADLAPADTEAQRRLDEEELQAMRRVDEGIHQLAVAQDPPFAAEIENAMGLPSVKKAAVRAGEAGQSAGRVLELAFVEASFYGPQALAEQRLFDRAAIALEIATGIHADRPRVWYELAARRAQAGSKGPAVKALETAVAKGFADRAALAADARFAPLNTYGPFVQLLTKIGRPVPF